MSRLEDCGTVEEDDVVLAYLAGRLSGGDVETFERHYLGCDRCAAELERAVELRAALRAPSTDVGRAWWRSRALAVAASIAFVAVGLAFMAPRLWHSVAPVGTAEGPWRGGAQDLAVTALLSPGGGITLSWAPHPDAQSYTVRVLAGDGTTVLDRETTEAKMAIEAAELAGASVPLRVRVKAMSALGYAVGQSEAVEVRER